MAYEKPENTFEVRAFVPKNNNKDIKRWMIDKDLTDKNVASGLIISAYFNLLKEVEELRETIGIMRDELEHEIGSI